MAIENGESAKYTHLPIAIIGMGCRFPGDATSPSKLWDLCASGQNGYSSIPKERFSSEAWHNADKDKQGKTHTQGAYFLKEDVARFDAGFFNFPTEVANAMDPQLRLLLEVIYETTEDAGVPLEKLAGSNTSVFSGIFAKDYYGLAVRDPELLPLSFLTSNLSTMLANRISHFYDLHGASMAIDTGCSSGLTALHQACQSIISGDSKMSVVGATSLLLSQDVFIGLSTLGMVGPEGKCYAWDSRAEGYGRGEGVAALLLKPLDAAIKDGDHVHAVIRSTGINQDGKTTTITSPSLDAQVELIRTCYERAGVDISETGYVEAHMTGTQVGDVTEAEALARTFGQSQASDTVLVGSVKTNVGHTEPVSGLAAIIKTAYALQHRRIPPNLNYLEGNPKIPLKDWKLQVPTGLSAWPSGKPLRASVNNFGYGGSNSHVVMEAVSPYAINTAVNGLSNGSNGHVKGFTNGANGANGHVNGHINGTNDHSNELMDPQGAAIGRIYLLSAKDSGVCQQMAKDLAAFLRQRIQDSDEPTPADLTYTLSERRSRFPWTRAVRASNMNELAERLDQPSAKPVHATTKPRLGFVFNGQGAQWHAMGRELISTYPVFRDSLHEAERILKSFGASWSLKDELMRDEKSTRVGEINLSQPISVALQLCLVDLLRSWDITPSAVSSHSSGEIAAAYAAGVLSFSEALGVVYFRGELALKHQKLSPLVGGMLAAGIGLEKCEDYLANLTGGQVVVACINSPESVTLSGDLPAIEEVEARLQEDGLFARKLKVPMAYHSHHMSPMAADYVDSLRSILGTAPAKRTSTVPFASPVTGNLISAARLSPEHWARNLTGTVRFSEAFSSMCSSEANINMIVEIGAHGTLAGPIRQILKSHGQSLPYVSTLTRMTNAVDTMQDLACDLLSRGYPLNLKAINFAVGAEQPKMVLGLPSYPWDHNTRYWVDSRVDRDLRNPRFPPHELLGTPVPGATGSTPTWRNFLRLNDLPWLSDHQVDSQVVLPGAGYVVMAIEAARMLTASSSSTTSGYRLRDVNIANALTIPDTTDGIEVHTQLRPCSEGDMDHRGWYEFEINSVDPSGSWIKNCNGFVSAVPDNTKKSPLFRDVQPPDQRSFFDPSTRARNLDVGGIYASMREMNICHGPAFQNLLNGEIAGRKTISQLSIPAVASETWDYIVHPTTLDTIVQAMFGGFPDEFLKGSMTLPRSIGNLFVPSDLERRTGHQLKVFSELKKAHRSGFHSNLSVTSVHSDALPQSFIQIDDFFCQAIPTGMTVDPSADEAALCSKTRWELDTTKGIPNALKDTLKINLASDEADFEKKILRASYYFVSDAAAQLKDDDQSKWTWYHRIFYEWMQYMIGLGAENKLATGSKSWSRTSKGLKQMLFDELSSGSITGKLIVRTGLNLVPIIRGEVTPLDLMMEDDLLNQYYMQIPRLKRSYTQLKAVMELYAAKNPGAKVLEIGGGTAGATQTVLNAFGSRGDSSGSLLGHYTFTDVSSGFFEAAQQKLAAWSGLIDFATLDIESDPTTQSFSEGSYDLVVASLVLHATKDLKKTMSHVRKLLKPSGTLVMIEGTEDRMDSQLIFGTFPGWWLSEEKYRKHSPNVSVPIWQDILKATGFTGIDFDIGDCEQDQYQSLSVIVSTACETSAYPSNISIVHTDTASQQWMSQLADAIQSRAGVRPSIDSFDNLDSVQNKVLILTPEFTAPLLSQTSETSFNILRKALTECQGVLWLSAGSLIDGEFPKFAATQGLLRTLRLEHSDVRYVHLDFEKTTNPWSEDKIAHVLDVLGQSFDANKDFTETEWEYAVRDGVRFVPRVYADKDEDDVSGQQPQLEPFHQSERPVVWEPPASNSLSDLCFTDALHMYEDIPKGMVEVKAEAFGLNFRDVMIALGQLDDTLVGHEFSGFVTGLGPDTEESGLQIGDRVCGIAQGRFASSCRAYWTGVSKIPDDMIWEDAASIPIPYITAWHSLVTIGQLQKGESVLIHAAAGGVGQAAIVVAQHLGATLFVTCSTEEKRDLLINTYGIDPQYILSSRDTSFSTAIMDMTNGKGVDVVLNSLSGALLKATWNSIARFGRFIEIGKVDMEAARGLDTTPFRRCATYAGVDILQLNEYQGPQTRKALKECVQICYSRVSRKLGRPMDPIERYPISEMEKAMRKMQSGLHLGKLVLVPEAGNEVKIITRQRPVSLANADATYLVVGGIGGIGKAIALWMVEKEAKNIVVVSRNAENHAEAPELIDTARSQGCRLVIRNCDVGDEGSFLGLLSYCASSGLPPIRGVINCAMVLDDTIFVRMTHEQWQRGINAKINSSINLDKHLPSDLSFFVMLSSIVGVIGHTSQSNYAAGNAFQDALVRHRTSKGQAATALGLSGVLSVGFVASRGQVQDRVERLGTKSVDIKDVLRLVENAALRRPIRQDPDDAQVSVGLAAWDKLADEAPVRRDRRFGTLRLTSPLSAAGSGSQEAEAAASNPSAMLSSALAAAGDDQETSVARAVAQRLAAIFNVSVDGIELSSPMSATGVDSLVAVELRNWLLRTGKAKVSIFEILHSKSLVEFAALVIERSSLAKKGN